jgi:hypothetical protein
MLKYSYYTDFWYRFDSYYFINLTNLNQRYFLYFFTSHTMTITRHDLGFVLNTCTSFHSQKNVINIIYYMDGLNIH